ncbi:MAG: hypothetical protein OEM27_00170 [Nitrospinota bacterium]|nr:hypothetical protein [Nitrospinota bacterium]
MLNYPTKLFQLSLITIFTTLLFLGTAGVNIALAPPVPNSVDSLEGKTVIKETCFKGPDKPVVRKIKSDFFMQIDKSALRNQMSKNGGLTPFPSWTQVIFDIFDFDGQGNLGGFDGTDGVALSKNLKKGTFQVFVNNGNPIFLSLSGVLVVDKNGNSTKIVGKINGSDTTNDCIYQGSFNGKRPKSSEDPS